MKFKYCEWSGTCELECNSGYTLSGTSQQVCTDSGEWSEADNLPFCYQIRKTYNCDTEMFSTFFASATWSVRPNCNLGHYFLLHDLEDVIVLPKCVPSWSLARVVQTGEFVKRGRRQNKKVKRGRQGRKAWGKRLGWVEERKDFGIIYHFCSSKQTDFGLSLEQLQEVARCHHQGQTQSLPLIQKSTEIRQR